MTAAVRIIVAAALAGVAGRGGAGASPAAPGATPDAPRGWRGDGSGRFPKARPVTEWSAARNVLWKARMPAPSDAQPVVAGEVVFACAEPFTLLCLRRSDGKVLWRKFHEYEALLSPGELAKARKDLAMARGIRRNELRVVLDRLKESGREMGGASGDTAIVRQNAGLIGRKKAIERRLAALERYRLPAKRPLTGYAFATPVTDGETVFAFFGNGVAAVYDLQGNRRWIRLIRKPHMAFGRSMSPVLADRAYVLAINDRLVAVDRETGQDVWEHAARPQSPGPAGARIGKLHVVVTSDGRILRASDGQELHKMAPPSVSQFGVPVIHGGVLYHFAEREHVLVKRFDPAASGGAPLRDVAAGRVLKGTYYASCLVHDGYVYVCQKSHVLSVVAAANGRRVYAKKLRIGGTAYASPTLGGRYVFVGSDNGTMVVLEPVVTRPAGGEATFRLKEIARNRLEGGRSSPVFASQHMFWRGTRHLYCIGTTGGPPAGADPDAAKKPQKKPPKRKDGGVPLDVLLGEQ